METIYFDNNATTQVDQAVLEAMLPFFHELYGNPSSMHSFGGQVGRRVREAREQVAALLGAALIIVIILAIIALRGFLEGVAVGLAAAASNIGLLARQNGKPLVPDGENKYHAIFGNGPAYFVSASSLGPPLAALGARVKLVSPKGARELPIEKFFVIPKEAAEREVALAPNEILTEILVPAAAVRNATYEIRQKTALDFPLATASVAFKKTFPVNPSVTATSA